MTKQQKRARQDDSARDKRRREKWQAKIGWSHDEILMGLDVLTAPYWIEPGGKEVAKKFWTCVKVAEELGARPRSVRGWRNREHRISSGYQRELSRLLQRVLTKEEKVTARAKAVMLEGGSA
jgi:hypothetical protein